MNSTLVILAGIFFIFFMTSLGSSLVFFVKNDINGKINSLFMGFSSGIMIAASIWSLIIPSLNMSVDYTLSFLPASIGILLGSAFLMILDKLIPVQKLEQANGKDACKIKKLIKMFVAITVHNIPEGLAVGFAFGSAYFNGNNSAIVSALCLSIGIGIQNFPEGAAISLPMQSEIKNKHKSFLLGVLSGVVEPIFATVGFFLATNIIVVQPWLLSFAAGAMLFVVAEELIPESQSQPNTHFGTWGIVFGFVVMMILDVVM